MTTINFLIIYLCFTVNINKLNDLFLSFKKKAYQFI